VSDVWPGIESFFVPGEEILLAESSDDVIRYLAELSDDERFTIGARARARVLSEHTASRRAEQLESLILGALRARRRPSLTAAERRPAQAGARVR
jgi:spore maturation protein CgeB